MQFSICNGGLKKGDYMHHQKGENENDALLERITIAYSLLPNPWV